MTEFSLDWLGRFKNPSLQLEFILHCTKQRSSYSFLAITILLLSWMIVESIASIWFSHEYAGKNQYPNQVYGFLSLSLETIVLVIAAIITFSLVDFKHRLTSSYLQVVFIVTLTFIFLLKLIKQNHIPPPTCIPADFKVMLASSLSSSQQVLLQGFLSKLPPFCPGKDDFLALVNFRAITVMVYSFQLLTSILYEPRFYLLVICHIPTTVLLLYTNYSSAYALFPNVMAFLVIDTFLVHIQLQRIQSFLHQRKVQQLLEENQKNADANHAMEMRHMISNIAHDLKTVRDSDITLTLPILTYYDDNYSLSPPSRMAWTSSKTSS